MSERSINFDNKKIKISDFYKNIKIFKIDEIDVNKILVSEKEPYGAKGAFKKFKDKKTKITTTTMSLIIKDKQLF